MGKSRKSPDERSIIDWAKERGWTPLHRNGCGHLILQHGPTGAKTRIPSKTPGGHLKAAVMSQIKKAEQSNG